MRLRKLRLLEIVAAYRVEPLGSHLYSAMKKTMENQLERQEQLWDA
jgi:hypothetical protein